MNKKIFGLSLVAIVIFSFFILKKIVVSKVDSQASMPSGMQVDSNSNSQTLLNYLFNNNDYGVREGPRTDGVLIVQNHKLIFEKYARGYGPKQKHILWSVSKTITALLYGVAIKEKKVHLDQSICDFVAMNSEEKCLITVRDLLTWSSGLDWNEEYENASELRKSSVVAMLYGEGGQDMATFVKNQILLPNTKPGEKWRYSSGDTLLAAQVLGEIYKGQDLRQVVNEKFFAPLEVTDWSGESDDRGVLGGAFYFYLTLPDMVKVGELILSNGKYNGHEIVKPDFIQFMKEIPPAFKAMRLDYNGSDISGAHLWLNDPKNTGLVPPWPKAPLDAVVARGHWGQYLVVIPSLKLVAARIGDTRDGSVKAKDFIEMAAALGQVVDTSPAISHETQIKMHKDNKEFATNRSEKFTHDKEYRDGRIDLGLAFTAKNFCSCLFVSKNTEERCRDYAALKQISPTLSVDYKNRRTTSSWFYLFKREAQYFESEKGCRLVSAYHKGES